MKKLSIRALCLLLALSCILTVFAACNSQDTPDSSADKGETPSSSAAQGASAPEKTEPSSYGDLKNIKYDPPITIKVVAPEFAGSVLAFDEVNKSRTDNVWITEYRERYGINVEYMWIVDKANSRRSST